MSTLILRNGRVEGKPADITIEGERIAAVEYLSEGAGAGAGRRRGEEVDLAGAIVLPGMIDPHIHSRDPGQKDKEDWQSVTAAAIRGGVTTVMDMPNNVPPVTGLETLSRKRSAAASSPLGKRFYLCATEHTVDELREAVTAAPPDLAGIKLFLAASSRNEVVEREETLRRVFALAARHDIVVAVHAELQRCIARHAAAFTEPALFDHGRIRHRECAIAATRLALSAAAEEGCRLYLAHVSTAEELELIAAAKARPGAPAVYCEATPHHLFLTEDAYLRSADGCVAKVNPPLRTAADQAALQEALRAGLVDTIGSDHAPHRPAEKQLPYRDAPSGFPGLETSLPLLVDFHLQGSLSLQRLAEVTSGRAAEIFALPDRAAVAPGRRADFAVIDPEASRTVDAAQFRSKARYSPFDGMRLSGAITMTVLGGAVHTHTQTQPGGARLRR